MEKVKINMIGGGFQHQECSSHLNVTKDVEWVKDGSADISFHIDGALLSKTNPSKKNYGLIYEASQQTYRHVMSQIRNNISQIENNYELIFTHDRRLVSLSKKMRLVPAHQVPWIGDRKIHKKSKLLSMIASTKTMCPAHVYRQSVWKKYVNQLDLFGTGHNPSREIEKKEIGLNDYYFSIVVENDNYPDWISEKVTDCFATGTIPIYWGAPTIGEFFNEKGIITLTDDFKVSDLSPELYYSKMEYIEDNFERVMNMPISEDYIYNKFIK